MTAHAEISYVSTRREEGEEEPGAADQLEDIKGSHSTKVPVFRIRMGYMRIRIRIWIQHFRRMRFRIRIRIQCAFVSGFW
jgi:hypothetical protein